MAYAIIRSGGKQYRVAPGQRVRVEKLDGEVGSELALEEVLLIGDAEGSTRVGRPRVEGAVVKAKIANHGKGSKIIVFRKRRRKGFHKKQGHRQLFTELEITEIAG